VSLVETGVGNTSASGLQDFQLYVGNHAKSHRGNTQSVIEHKTDLPVAWYHQRIARRCVREWTLGKTDDA
jgi:hypothetical protein